MISNIYLILSNNLFHKGGRIMLNLFDDFDLDIQKIVDLSAMNVVAGVTAGQSCGGGCPPR